MISSKEDNFLQVIQAHKQTIYAVCYMFSKNKDELDDLFQDVLVNMWKGFEGFKARSDVRTWIYRVSLNTCISVERKQKKHRYKGLPTGINLFDDMDEVTAQANRLHQRITRLDFFDRALILLWLENMSYEEIGEVVGISAKNVSVRLYRIKERLKNISD